MVEQYIVIHSEKCSAYNCFMAWILSWWYDILTIIKQQIGKPITNSLIYYMKDNLGSKLNLAGSRNIKSLRNLFY